MNNSIFFMVIIAINLVSITINAMIIAHYVADIRRLRSEREERERTKEG